MESGRTSVSFSSSEAALPPTSRSTSSGRLRERGAAVRCILTKGAQEFVTPLAAASLRRTTRAYGSLRPRPTRPISAISASRAMRTSIIVAPATANLMAKMASGHADDLASTVAPRDDAADPPRAGDERAHVAAPGDAAQPRDAAGPRRSPRRAERRRDGRSGVRSGPHGRAARDRCGRRAAFRARRSARRQARRDHVRPHA